MGENDPIRLAHIFQMGWFNHQLVESNDDGFSKLTWQSKTKHFRIESLNHTQLEVTRTFIPSWVGYPPNVQLDLILMGFCASGGAATAKGGG